MISEYVEFLNVLLGSKSNKLLFYYTWEMTKIAKRQYHWYSNLLRHRNENTILQVLYCNVTSQTIVSGVFFSADSSAVPSFFWTNPQASSVVPFNGIGF